MSYCECDYESPTVYNQSQHVARKEHRCSECRRAIMPGEPYESTFGIWEREGRTYKTCAHCLAIREWVTAHVPCACWAHGNVLEDARDTVEAYAHQAPGLAMGYLRRVVAKNRAKLAHPPTQRNPK